MGNAARLLGLLMRARTHISPDGWLELDAVLPYRAASYSLYVTATSILRGVLGGWARQARQAARRFGPATVLRTGPALEAAHRQGYLADWSPKGPTNTGSSTF